MFRRLNHNLPPDSYYPPDLAALGYKLNERNQIVKTADESSFFQFYITDNDRANQMHKEALHEALRPIVLMQLFDLGVTQLYLHGEGYVDVKPEGPHIEILVSELESLKKTRDVIVVVNEAIQDLGIWAYRILEHDGGIDGGSAVGMIKKLRARVSRKADRELEVMLETISNSIANKLQLDDLREEASAEDSPGVIILNPGQLLYSHKLNKCMTQASWLARPKKNALAEFVRIDEKYNKVVGHKSPPEHIATVFEHILPKITHPDARLYIVAGGAEAETILTYIDGKLHADPAARIGGQIEAVALMQPSHDHKSLLAAPLTNFLLQSARSYVMSDRPKGTLLAVPKELQQPIHYVDNARSTQSIVLQETSPQTTEKQRHEREGSSFSVSVKVPISGEQVQGPSDCAVATKAQSNSCLDESSELLPQSPSTLQRSMSSLNTVPSNGGKSGSGLGHPDNHLEDSYSTISKSALLGRSNESLEEPDAYANDEVSCPTFSAGPDTLGVTEIIWPLVMDDVLTWFADMREQANARENALVAGKGNDEMREVTG